MDGSEDKRVRSPHRALERLERWVGLARSVATFAGGMFVVIHETRSGLDRPYLLGAALVMMGLESALRSRKS